VYVPGVETVMDGAVDPLLHNNVPVKSCAVKTEPPQLSVTKMVGVATTGFIGSANPLPAPLVHPLTDCVTV
jgi:hypothetical protein